MRLNCLFFALFLILLSSLWGQTPSHSSQNTSDLPTMVMFCSACNDEMELRIGDEDENVAESGVLKQWSVTRLIPINQYGTFDIYYKYPDEDEWSIWEDADTYDLYSVPITKGSILTIVLHNDGSISDMDCFFPNNLKAKVSFVIGTE
ncbi:MAG TPA: hypothetical protein PKK33_06015, partial [Candidatus Cloacimonadota bacterium]|nr:hypothetical protein [Candidatus Cloacimonadota bacterium]